MVNAYALELALIDNVLISTIVKLTTTLRTLRRRVVGFGDSNGHSVALVRDLSLHQ